MDNKPTIFRVTKQGGLDLEKQPRSSGRSGAFFLTSLFIELIEGVLSVIEMLQQLSEEPATHMRNEAVAGFFHSVNALVCEAVASGPIGTLRAGGSFGVIRPFFV